MQQKTKKLNCLKTRPLGSAVVLIAVLLFSGLLSFAYLPSKAYAASHTIFFPVVFKPLEITLAWGLKLGARLGRVQTLYWKILQKL